MKYVRRRDLEKINCHVVVVGIIAAITFRLICVFRSFRPQDNISPKFLFETQLGLFREALTSNCYVMGDFNLDAMMENRPDYDRRIPLNKLNNFANQMNLLQIVTKTAWSHVINDIKKSHFLTMFM